MRHAGVAPSRLPFRTAAAPAAARAPVAPPERARQLLRARRRLGPPAGGQARPFSRTRNACAGASAATRSPSYLAPSAIYPPRRLHAPAARERRANRPEHRPPRRLPQLQQAPRSARAQPRCRLCHPRRARPEHPAAVPRHHALNRRHARDAPSNPRSTTARRPRMVRSMARSDSCTLASRERKSPSPHPAKGIACVNVPPEPTEWPRPGVYFPPGRARATS